LTGFYKNIEDISYFNFKTNKIIFFFGISWSFLFLTSSPNPPFSFKKTPIIHLPHPANYRTTKMLGDKDEKYVKN